jgi:acetylornithine deacetylase
MMINELFNTSVSLLKDLISTPSLSGEESKTAEIIKHSLESAGIKTQRKHNNIYAFNRDYRPEKPTILLNSHHDTVKASAGWTVNPFQPILRDGKLIGLGSNDDGASLVSLIATFKYFYDQQDLNHNLVLAVTGEEENSGINGIRAILSEIGSISLAVVGEPTGMKMAIAEKGLMVLRCQAKGVSGHAARDIGENAILNAIEDIRWFSSFEFPKTSSLLGPVKMTVTMIQAGSQHNVIPDRCDFTVDIRTTDVYSNKEILDVIRGYTASAAAEPSLDLNPSKISENHPFVKVALQGGIHAFGSPTLSDQTFINAPSVKIGPGMSERSHTADEFVYISEIEEGIKVYIDLFTNFLTQR